MLCGLVEPRLLVRMSVMPAHSSTGAHRATGDDAGTGRGRLQQHPAGAVLADDLVRDRRARPRAPRPCCAWPPRRPCGPPRTLRSPCRSRAHLALAVAHRHERVEREAPAALHDLGDAVDRDHVLDELAAVALALPVASAAAAPAAAVAAAAAAARRRPPPPPRCCRGSPRGRLGRRRSPRAPRLADPLFVAIRTPVRLRGRPRPPPSRGHDTGNRRGRTRPW